MQWCVEEALMEALELHEAAAVAAAQEDAGDTAPLQRSQERLRRVMEHRPG